MPSPDPARPGPPRLIATDLDGTFLSPDGSVSRENAAAVLAAQAAGIPVLFATGRPVRWLDVIHGLPGAHPTVIASNGAVLYDLDSHQIIDRICLDPEAALEALVTIRAAIPGVSFAFESGARFGYEPRYRIRGSDDGRNPALFSGPAEEIAASEPFVKMLVQSVDVPPDELLDRVRAGLGSSLTATHAVTDGIGLVEVSAPGVSKASMLQRCCDQLEIPLAQVAAFGDMPNDEEMLSLVGWPHVVANAHPRLLAGRYPIVGHHAESGVGRAIAALLGATAVSTVGATRRPPDASRGQRAGATIISPRPPRGGSSAG